MPETTFYAGQHVYDKKRSDPTDDQLVVVDPNLGPVEDLPMTTKRHVTENDVNLEIGFHPDTLCVSAVYIEETPGAAAPCKLGEKAYTFPQTRLAPMPKGPTVMDRCAPFQWTLVYFLRELSHVLRTNDEEYSITVEDLQVLCMEAAVDGHVIMRGTEDASSYSPVR